MKLSKSFCVDGSPDNVWALLSDVKAVAECVPGFELKDEIAPGVYDGQFKVRVGPITAKLAGQGTLELDEENRLGRVEGKGVDRRGGSRVSGVLDYRVSPADRGTEISIDSEIQLSGPLAQVGRTGIIQGIADQLTEEFAANLECRLNSGTNQSVPDAGVGAQVADNQDGAGQNARPGLECPAPVAEFNVGTAFWSSLWSAVVSIFRRKR